MQILNCWIRNLCASCGSAAAVDAVELCEAQVFFGHRGLHCFLLKRNVEERYARKELNHVTVAFCFIERRGDNYGRWQGRQGTEFFLKPFDFLCCTFKDSKALLRVLCSFPARPCRQMEAMEREAGCRVMAGCGFSSVVDPFQDFVTWFLEKEMTEVAGSMKERTVTKAGQFYDDHLWSHMDHHGLNLTPPRQCGWCDRFKSRPLAQRETQWSDGLAQRWDVTERVVLGTWMYLVLVVLGCSKVEMVGKQVQALKIAEQNGWNIIKHHETYRIHAVFGVLKLESSGTDSQIVLNSFASFSLCLTLDATESSLNAW